MKPSPQYPSNTHPVQTGKLKVPAPKDVSLWNDLPEWDPEDLKRLAAKLRSISILGFPRTWVPEPGLR